MSAAAIFAGLALLGAEAPAAPALSWERAGELPTSDLASLSLAQLGERFVEREMDTLRPPLGEPLLAYLTLWTRPEIRGAGLCGADRLMLYYNDEDTPEAEALAKAGHYSKLPVRAKSVVSSEVFHVLDDLPLPEQWTQENREKWTQACTGLTSAKTFFAADGASIARPAAALFLKAVAEARSGRTSFSLACWEDGRACARPNDRLSAFTVAQIEQIRFNLCSPGGRRAMCYTLYLADPADPRRTQWWLNMEATGDWAKPEVRSIVLTRSGRPVH